MDNVLAVCPECSETVDIRKVHTCKKKRTIHMLQQGVLIRKRTVTVFQRH